MDSVCLCSPRQSVSQSAHLLLCIISRCFQLPRGWGGSTWGRRRKEIGSPHCSSLLPSAASVNLEGSWPFLPLYPLEVLVLPGPAAVPAPLELSLSLTETCDLWPPHPVAPSRMPHAHLFAWSLGREEPDPTVHASPLARDHCGTPSPMCPEADQPHFFFKQLAFLTKPSLYRTAPFDNSFGVPSLPFFCSFSTSISPPWHLQTKPTS